jgi:hypothetical protein
LSFVTASGARSTSFSELLLGYLRQNEMSFGFRFGEGRLMFGVWLYGAGDDEGDLRKKNNEAETMAHILSKAWPNFLLIF